MRCKLDKAKIKAIWDYTLFIMGVVASFSRNTLDDQAVEILKRDEVFELLWKLILNGNNHVK